MGIWAFGFVEKILVLGISGAGGDLGVFVSLGLFWGSECSPLRSGSPKQRAISYRIPCKDNP